MDLVTFRQSIIHGQHYLAKLVSFLKTFDCIKEFIDGCYHTKFTALIGSLVSQFLVKFRRRRASLRSVDEHKLWMAPNVSACLKGTK